MANTASVSPSAFREGFAVNIAPVHSSCNDTASISGTVSGVASLNIVALESVTVSPIVRLSAELANRTSTAVYPLGTTGSASHGRGDDAAFRNIHLGNQPDGIIDIVSNAAQGLIVWNISQSKRIRGNHAAFGDGLRRNDDGLRGNRQSHALQGREYGKSGAQRSK